MSTPAGPVSPGIPAFNTSGVLPPYIGTDPGTSGAEMSPYLVTIEEVVHRFNTSPERIAILQGYLQFRTALRSVGIQGWQWLDGSFLENIEVVAGRAPQDLDIVTFCPRPASVTSQADRQDFVSQHLHLFERNQTKANFRCDAFFVDLNTGAYPVVSLTRFWFGLFSHQRTTAVWKGMLEVTLPLVDTDLAARAVLGI